jgi:beta-lactamase regulating signal transducer with metallopeptidase domain
LPVEYVDWSEAKRQAVLSHEGSHVAHGDFYVLLLAAFNRAVFWFSPFAWWQLVRLTELAEIISDDAALEMLDDRSSYAGILLDVAGRRQRAPVAIAMARACTVRKRVVGENARWSRPRLLPR